MKTTFIYALCEPETRKVRYIGKTNNLKTRFGAHLRQSSKKKTPLGDWLQGLLIREEKPTMILLRKVEGDGSEAEMRYIRLARGCRMALTNATDGGDGVTVTPELRAARSRAMKGRVLSPAQCAAIGDRQRGVPKSIEHCKALSAGQQRRAEKDRAAGILHKNSGRKQSPAQCLAKSYRLLGGKLSEEHKTNIGNSVRGDKNGNFGKIGLDNPLFGRKRKGSSSSYRGVIWVKSRNTWRALIRVSGKDIYLGAFGDEIEAARAVDLAAVKFYGDKAVLNFPTVSFGGVS